jgi:CheY-like chemotaxis protein
MLTSVSSAHRCARLEAVPRDTGSSRPFRSSIDDQASRHRAVSGEAREAPASRPGRLPSVLVGLRILVVDDDEDTAEVFAVALTACGAAVSIVRSAREALRSVMASPPDVVLSDIAMPGEDGYWLLREVAGLPDATGGRVPMIAATAYGREHSRARVLAAGFVDHLRKPVDPEALCRAVARAAGR